MQRLRLVLLIVLVLLVACRAQPTPPPPLPTPVPRTPVPLSPRAITTENAGQVGLLGCLDDAWQLLAFSPDSSLLAVACQGGICLHDTRTLARIRRFSHEEYYLGHEGYYLSAAFSPDGRILATGTPNGKVWLWRVGDGTLERVLEARDLRFWAVAFSADGATLVASDLTPEVFVWRVADGELLRSFRGEVPRNYRPLQPIAVALSPDGALLARKERGEIRVWRTDDGSPLRFLTIQGRSTATVDFAGAGRFLVACGERFVLWERQQGDLALVGSVAQGDSSSCPALSPDGRLLATAGIPLDTLLLRRVQDGATLQSLETRHGRELGGPLFSPDGSLLVTWGPDGICLWGLAP